MKNVNKNAQKVILNTYNADRGKRVHVFIFMF